MAKIPAVLVVDPDVNVRTDVKKALTRAQFTLAGESGLGIDAVSLARSIQPEVILISNEEPVMPALQTIEALANALPETPIVVYSSLSNMETVRKAMLAGARDYLVKPLSSAELSRSIYTVLEAEEKRRMRHARQMESVPMEGVVITVASLKGGVGKTTTAVNLAIALRRETGQSVALIDTEPNYGDVAILMGMDDVPLTQSLSHVARRSDELDRNSVLDYLIPHPTGVLVLPTAAHLDTWQEVQPERVQKLIRLIAQTQDYLVVDTPAGLHDATAAALETASLDLLVTTPDITSIKDTILALNMLKAWGLVKEKIRVVMNHTYSRNGVRNEDVRQVLEHEIFWNIPYDPEVQTCSQLGQAVTVAYPESKASQSMAGLAQAISGVKSRPQRNGLHLSPSRLLSKRVVGR